METNEVERIVIKPTIGRVVWYTPAKENDPLAGSDQPLAALVAYVWNDDTINLAVFDTEGRATNRTNVTLFQDGDALPESGNYAEWMPYQKGAELKARAAQAAMPPTPPMSIRPLGYEVIGGYEGSAQRTGLSAGGLIAAMERSPEEGDFSETTADNKPPEDQSAT